jgi:hypothetical protein
MTALAANRQNTNGVMPMPFVNGPVAPGVHIYAKALIACVAGFWVPATVAPGLQLGIAMEEVNNTGLTNIPIQVEFVKPKRLWLAKNDTVSPIVQAQIGGEGWVIDDCTVSATGALGTHTRVIPWQFYEANLQYTNTKVWVEVL